MTNVVSTEQALINYVMNQLPDVREKKEHTLKKGESLWKIAEKELGGKTHTNKEIRDYMLLIAKLNGLDTPEKMNGLKVNDKIYLPVKSSEKSDAILPKKEEVENSLVSRFENSAFTKYVINLKEYINNLLSATPINKVDKVEQKEEKPTVKSLNEVAEDSKKPDLEGTMRDLINTLKNDKTVRIESAALQNSDLYHVYNTKKRDNASYTNYNPLLSFELDEKGNFVELSLDDKNDLKVAYDYDVNKYGDVSYKEYPHEKVGTLKTDDFAALLGTLKGLLVKSDLIKNKADANLDSSDKKLSSVAETVGDIVNVLNNDRSIRLTQATPSSARLYHIMVRKDYGEGAVLSFVLDANDKVKSVSFNNKKDILPAKYDYDMDAKGNVVLDKYPYDKSEQLDNNSKNALINAIQRVCEEQLVSKN